MITITLRKGRDKPVRQGHPWVFSGAIERVEGTGPAGSPCVVRCAAKDVLAHGYFNPDSSIAVRIWAKGNVPYTSEELSRRIIGAVDRRASILGPQTSVCRLINSEGDFLPGLTVDAYGTGICIQIQTAGMELLRSEILTILQKHIKPAFIYERSDSDSRKQEGLPVQTGVVAGVLPDDLTVCENGLRFRVDLDRGQKTGFFADQRDSRLLLREYAAGCAVLDCFCYTGGFTASAYAGQARSVTAVDISAPAVEAAYNNAQLNNVSCSRSDFITADVFQYLRSMDTSYDLIVLDPPKFAKHRAEVDRAARGYKDINLVAMKRIKAGGILFTFSCSQAIDSRLFRQIVFAAAADSGRDVQVLHILGQPADHPFNIAHQEGEYLKGLVLRVL